MTNDHIIDTWRILTRNISDLLARIPPELMSARLYDDGWTIAYEFAHIHNVRVLWLRRLPDLAEGLPFFDEDDALGTDVLSDALGQSAAKVAQMLSHSIEKTGNVEGFGNHVQAFLGYLIAHEYYHVGEIGMIAGRNGFTLPLEVNWNWSSGH